MTIEKYELNNGWALFEHCESEMPNLVGIFKLQTDAIINERTIYDPQVVPCVIRGNCVIIDNDINTKTHEDLAKKLSL